MELETPTREIGEAENNVAKDVEERVNWEPFALAYTNLVAAYEDSKKADRRHRELCEKEGVSPETLSSASYNAVRFGCVYEEALDVYKGLGGRFERSDS